MKDDFIVIRNEKPKPKIEKKFLIIAGCVLLALIFIVIWLLNRSPKLPESIKIINYDSVREFLPNEAEKDLDLSLYYHLKQYFEVPEEKDSVEVEIRMDTYEKTTNSETNTARFIVDIDKFEQTYMVVLGWSDVSSDTLINTTIGCPVQELTKYEGVMCRSEEKVGNSIWALLPYKGEISSGEEFVVNQKEYFDGEKYLEVAIDSCGDENILKEALELTKEWVKSKGVNPEELSYETPAHYCPGQF